MRFVRVVLAILFLAPAIAALALVALLIVKQFAAAADEGRQGVLWGVSTAPVARS